MSVCRACLCGGEASQLHCMFWETPPLQLPDAPQVATSTLQPLHRLYTRCTGLPVNTDDGLSSKLCSNCIEHLTSVHNFVQQCERSEEQFRRMFPTDTKQLKDPSQFLIKLEPEELLIDADSQVYDDNDDEAEPLHCEPVKKIKKQHDVESPVNVKNEAGSDSDDSIDAEPLSAYVQRKYSVKDELVENYDNGESGTVYHRKKHKSVKRLAKYACDICKKTFVKYSGLTRHMTNHDAEAKPYACSECYQRFKRQDLLIRHSTVHIVGLGFDNFDSKDDDATGKYVCEECNMEFSSKNGHSSHMKIHKNDDKASGKKYLCNKCGKSFLVRSHLNRHVKIHMKIKQYKCTLCDKQYSRQDQLLTHMNKHNGVKPNVCTVCGKAFAQICNLKDHLRIHTGETPFLCSICGKGFNNGSNLRQHVQRHTGATPYACTLCPKKFISKGELTSHVVSHSGAHPYVCDVCGHAFTKPNSLKKHKRIHLGVKPFECDVCHMKFAYNDLLKRHYRIHTGEKPYPCKYCSRSFIQSNDLVKHTRLHIGENIYECKICKEKFRLQSDLKNHYPTHYIKTDSDIDVTKIKREAINSESDGNNIAMKKSKTATE